MLNRLSSVLFGEASNWLAIAVIPGSTFNCSNPKALEVHIPLLTL